MFRPVFRPAFQPVFRSVFGTGDEGGVTPVAPSNVSLPTVFREGTTIQCHRGSWTGTDNIYTYQWYRNTVLVADQTSAVYSGTANPTDDLYCQVTATNGLGSDSADSPVFEVPYDPPVNTVAPALSYDNTSFGTVVTTTAGTWGGSSSTKSYQWQRNGADIAGQTSNSYTLTTADNAASLACIVTATNPAGAVNQASNTLAMPNIAIPTAAALAIAGSSTAQYSSLYQPGSNNRWFYMESMLHTANALIGSRCKIVRDPNVYAIAGQAGQYHFGSPGALLSAQVADGTILRAAQTTAAAGGVLVLVGPRNDIGDTNRTELQVRTAMSDALNICSAQNCPVIVFEDWPRLYNASGPDEAVILPRRTNYNTWLGTEVTTRRTAGQKVSLVRSANHGEDPGNLGYMKTDEVDTGRPGHMKVRLAWVFAYDIVRILENEYSLPAAVDMLSLLPSSLLPNAIFAGSGDTNPTGGWTTGVAGGNTRKRSYVSYGDGSGRQWFQVASVGSGSVTVSCTITSGWAAEDLVDVLVEVEFPLDQDADGNAYAGGGVGMSWFWTPGFSGGNFLARTTFGVPPLVVVRPAGRRMVLRVPAERIIADRTGLSLTFTIYGTQVVRFGTPLILKNNQVTFDSYYPTLAPITINLPANTVAPALTPTSGYSVGTVLTVTNGTWTGPTITYTRQWLRDGVAISGATATTYTLQSGDHGSSISCRITAANSAGSVTADSNATGTLNIQVPANTVAPVASGSVSEVDDVVSVTNGTWSNSPTGYTYQWRRNGTPIGGATSSTYAVQLADNGTTLTCAVTASNAIGAGTAAVSNGLSITLQLGDVPTNTEAPEIGVEISEPGQEMFVVDEGTWTGDPPTIDSYSYQWTRGGVAIDGETSDTYLLQPLDNAAAIGCAVTATNATGDSSPVMSNTITIYFTPEVLDDPVIQQGTGGDIAIIQTEANFDYAASITKQWYRNGVLEAGETGDVYAGDINDGDLLDVRVTAHNDSKSATAFSNEITFVAAPANTVAPSIAWPGNTYYGNITLDEGDWVNTVDSTSYQWYKNNSPVSGQTAATYSGTLASGDDLFCRVTKTNAGGSVSADSNTMMDYVPYATVTIYADDAADNNTYIVAQWNTVNNGTFPNEILFAQEGGGYFIGTVSCELRLPGAGTYYVRYLNRNEFGDGTPSSMLTVTAS